MTEIRGVDLGSVDSLGPRARRCVYWQTDADPATVTESIGDTEFEKEAWISRVSLEWGVCGQLAEADEQPVAAAFYSPPGMVPRANSFPTSPVGSDAVLLAGLIDEEEAPAGVLTSVLGEVVEDLRSRGIKALEAFGVSGTPSGHPAPIGSRDGCGAASCVSPTSFLVEHGFSVVAPHEVYPRLRLDIESDHMWKADVERALDQLFAGRGIPLRRIEQLSGTTVSGRAGQRMCLGRSPIGHRPVSRAAAARSR